MNFTVYSKDGCPYCVKIKQILDHINANYTLKKLEEDFNKEEFYSIFGDNSTFPQVIMDDTHLGGCVDTVKYLRNQNII